MPLAPSQFTNTKWNLPGVSLTYVPQTQAIGGAANQSVIDAAKTNSVLAPLASTSNTESNYSSNPLIRWLQEVREKNPALSPDLQKYSQYSQY